MINKSKFTPYTNKRLASLKHILDMFFIFLLALGFGSGSINLWLRAPVSDAQDIILIIFSIVLAGLALGCIGILTWGISRFSKLDKYWSIKVDDKSIKLVSADSTLSDSFEYRFEDIVRLEKKARYDDGIQYDWWIYLHDKHHESALKLDTHPFNEEVIIDKMQKSGLGGDKVVEINIEGIVKPWVYKSPSIASRLFWGLLVCWIAFEFIGQALIFWIHNITNYFQ